MVCINGEPCDVSIHCVIKLNVAVSSDCDSFFMERTFKILQVFYNVQDAWLSIASCV